MHRARPGKPIANTLCAFPFPISRTMNYSHRMLKVSCHKPTISLATHTFSYKLIEYTYIYFYRFLLIFRYHICVLIFFHRNNGKVFSQCIISKNISSFAKVSVLFNYVLFMIKLKESSIYL